MVAALALTLAVVSGQGGPAFSPTSLPAWAVARWAAKDPFEGAWGEYARVLAKYPSYVEHSDWPERARAAIDEAANDPGNAAKLYRAGATYLVARDLDWRFELPSISLSHRMSTTALENKLIRIWAAYPKANGSKEFCRVGFVVCSAFMSFDAGDLPKALLAAYPRDRLVISGLVWYEDTRQDGRQLDRATWTLDQAKLLPGLPGARPQDYVTLASAYAVHSWSVKGIADCIGCRDGFVAFKKRVPAELGKHVDRDINYVEAYIKQHGGKSH